MKTIKELRIERGLSQSELARRVGIARNNYMLWEKKEGGMTADNLKKLADILEVRMDEIDF